MQEKGWHHTPSEVRWSVHSSAVVHSSDIYQPTSVLIHINQHRSLRHAFKKHQ